MICKMRVPKFLSKIIPGQSRAASHSSRALVDSITYEGDVFKNAERGTHDNSQRPLNIAEEIEKLIYIPR